MVLNYQQEIFDTLRTTKETTYILYHTIFDDYYTTLLFSSLTLHKKYKSTKPILIVSSNISINMLISYIKRYNININNFQFLSHKTFDVNVKQNENYCKDYIVVFDKIHYYRNLNKYTQNIVTALNKSKFTLLMTTNLLVNNVEDIIPIIALLLRIPLDESKDLFILQKNDNELFQKIFFDKISIRTNTDLKLNSSHFKLYENNINLYMSESILVNYSKIENEQLQRLNLPEPTKENVSNVNITEFKPNIKTLLFDYKKNSQELTLPEKFNWILTKLQKEIKSKNKNIIFLNNYNVDELKIMSSFLSKNNIKFLILSGNSSFEERKKILNKFNNDKIHYTLIINKIDKNVQFLLKNVKNVICLDPRLDDEQFIHLIDNIVQSNNMIQYGSKTRTDIYTLILKKPNKFNLFKLLFDYKKADSIDQWIQERYDMQKQHIKYFIKKLKNLKN